MGEEDILSAEILLLLGRDCGWAEVSGGQGVGGAEHAWLVESEPVLDLVAVAREDKLCIAYEVVDNFGTQPAAFEILSVLVII